jgi:hypothetical protein
MGVLGPPDVSESLLITYLKSGLTVSKTWVSGLESKVCT